MFGLFVEDVCCDILILKRLAVVCRHVLTV